MDGGRTSEREEALPWSARLPNGEASGESLQRFLASRAAEWWVAEQDSRIVGYCRSIERQGLFELTEFLVVADDAGKGSGPRATQARFSEPSYPDPLDHRHDRRACAEPLLRPRAPRHGSLSWP